jgi:quercetin dioxygenase-like cupin family protein
MKRLFFVSSIILALALGVALDRTVLAQQQQGMKRTILLRTDDPAAPSQELVLGLAEIQPGANSGRHVHHGVEVGYVLEGTLSIEYPGKPAVTVKTGETFKNEGPHTAVNPGKTLTKVLAAYLVEKGKPIADPAN